MGALAFVALGLGSWLLAARAMAESPRLERACAAAVLVPAAAIGIVYLLGAFRAIAPLPWLIATLLYALAAVAIGRAKGLALLRSDAIGLLEGARQLARDPAQVAAVTVATVALALAALSVYLLVPWAWDSVAYHLPIVYDALQTRTLRRVPTSVIYVNCYPRLVDVFFVAWRLSLSDDTWIEFGQLPFAPIAVLAIARLANGAGVPVWRGLALGSLFLAIPVVALELATAYVDVAVAALALASFALATGSTRAATYVAAGIAAGLLLGSKPSAPPVAAAALLVILVRSARARHFGSGVLACGIALAIGIWKYVENLREWNNPIWPADLRFGPLVLPGKATVRELATNGLREPYLSMGWLERILHSWTAWPDSWVFDMRIGGFGPLFTWGLLPLAVAAPIAAWRSRSVREKVARIGWPTALLVMTTLASPGAYWARYTLAVPGALLALAIATIDALAARWRAISTWWGIALGALGLALSWRGWTPGGPSLFELARATHEQRIAAFALDAQEPDWERARARIGPGEAFGYDWSFGLPGRLVRPDGRGRVVFLEATTPTLEELLDWARRERVRVVVLGEGPTGAADLARAHPEHFRELFRSAYPEWQPCAVFEILDAPSSAQP